MLVLSIFLHTFFRYLILIGYCVIISIGTIFTFFHSRCTSFPGTFTTTLWTSIFVRIFRATSYLVTICRCWSHSWNGSWIINLMWIKTCTLLIIWWCRILTLLFWFSDWIFLSKCNIFCSFTKLIGWFSLLVFLLNNHYHITNKLKFHLRIACYKKLINLDLNFILEECAQ